MVRLVAPAVRTHPTRTVTYLSARTRTPRGGAIADSRLGARHRHGQDHPGVRSPESWRPVAGSDRPVRVLHVLTDTDRRGAQVFASELSARLGGLGLESELAALGPGAVGGLSVDTLGDGGLTAGTLAALRRAMARADVTVAHGSRTLLAAAVAGAGPGRPFVYRQISDPLFWAGTAARRRRVRAYYRCPKHVVALSSITETVLRRHFFLAHDRITVIPNAADEHRCPPASEEDRQAARHRLGCPVERPVVGYVGALVEEKGVADLVRALPPGAVLVVAGDGPARASVEAQARMDGADVRFLGPVRDPWDLYAAADVVALPSRGGDTQPAVLIEAALVGRACVTTSVGAITDIVQDQRTGRVVGPGDVAALRAALVELLADPGERARLGATARHRALARFSMTTVAEKWRRVLGAIAADCPS